MDTNGTSAARATVTEVISDADSNSSTRKNIPNTTKVGQLDIGAPRQLHLNDLSKPNMCYIINNNFAKKPSISLKTQYDIDVKNIGETFAWLNFNIKVKRDLDISGIDKLLRGIAQKDHTDEKCIALFILSHGTEDGEILGSDHRKYNIEALIEKLQGIETLVDKPKLVFIQACRGAEEMEVANVVRVAGSNPIRVAKKSNTFVYYSTMQGNKAYCSTVYGSFFIYALCQVLWEYHKNVNVQPSYHFGDVVTRVNDFLSSYVRDFVLQGEKELKTLVQVSEARSSLCQQIFFYPSQKNYDKYVEESKLAK